MAAVITFLALIGRIATAGENHVLRIADAMDVDTLDPWYATTANVTRLSELTMAKFSRFDRRGRLVPELVTQIPTLENGGISAHGRRVTWHLRRGVRWSDGATFDAQDVLFTIAATKNTKNAFVTAGTIENIARAKALDPYTVVTDLKRPDSESGQLFGTYGLECILPRHALAGLPSLKQAAYNALPIGIGPFRYVRFTRGSSVVMEANPYYFRGRPKLDRIEYRIMPDVNSLALALQTGEIDLWPGVGSFADRLSRLPGIRLTRRAGTSMNWLEFNVSQPLVSDSRMRRALRAALDRRGFLANVLHGYGTVTDAVVPPLRPDAPATVVSGYDPALAERLLDAAGWRATADGARENGGQRLRLRFIVQSGSPAASTIVELVRAAWQRVGVAIDVRQFSIAQLFAPAEQGGPISSGTFDVALAGGDPYDPVTLQNFFGCTSVPPHGLNDSRYCNRSVDAALHRASESPEASRRRADLQVAQSTIVNDAPIAIVYRVDDVVAVGRRVTDFGATPFTLLDDMMSVDTP